MNEECKKIRREILDLALKEEHGHIAPAMSTVEIMYTLFDKIMTKDDKFILSKGHACLSLYVMLKRKGLNPNTYWGHPEIDVENGIECTTGSLGHGLPVAVGMALAKKFKKEPGKVYVLMGDGECQEGSTWESIQIAVHNHLNNLVIIVDANELQALNSICYVLSGPELLYKFDAFGCHSNQVDGHELDELEEVLKADSGDEPHCIIADTVKGCGMKCAECIPEWHYRIPTEEQLKQIYEDLK